MIKLQILTDITEFMCLFMKEHLELPTLLMHSINIPVFKKLFGFSLIDICWLYSLLRKFFAHMIKTRARRKFLI